MKQGWEPKKVGDILSLEYGKPLSKGKRTSDGLYPVYGANGVKDRTNEYYSDEPSIIVGRKGSAGEINYTEEKFWPLDVTYFAKFDKTELNLDFLYHLLSLLELPTLAKGVKPGINRNDVYAIDTSIPPLPEQKRIVAILDRCFEAIDKAKANVERNLQNAKDLFQSQLNQIFTKKGEGWVEKKLGEVNKFIDYRGSTPKKVPEGIRLITAKNVRMGYLKEEPEEFINTNDYESWMTRGTPRKNDVLFTTEAPLANVALLDTDEKIALAQRIITFAPDRGVLTGEYLHYCLQSKEIQDKILAKGTGATVSGIKSRLLKEITIFIPSPAIQRKIIVLLDELKDQTKSLESKYQRESDVLDELKKSILQKAFNGELTETEEAA